jgi:hypothetical protein
MNPLRPHRGSHLPVLIKLVNETTGPIIEFGSGVCSTYFLHWACFATRRKLVTCENNKEYFDFAARFADPRYHTVLCVDDFDYVDGTGPWSIAFIDHEPPQRRGVEMRRMQDCADYVIVHDTDSGRMAAYGFDADSENKFKYSWRLAECRPYTSVFSNKIDLTGFSLR